MLALCGCGANVGVRVAALKDGSGSVTVTLSISRGSAAALQDLQEGLPVSDLERAGWVVQGPRTGPGGATVVSAHHSFARLAEVPVLVADIAGSGSLSERPFRLSLAEHNGILEDHFDASGAVDLSCSLLCFGDPRLGARTGYPLGMPASQLAQLLGSRPGKEISFSFQLLLPGTVVTSNASRVTKAGLQWSLGLGRATSLEASSRVVNVGFIRDVLIGVGAGSLLVVATAAYLMARRRRGRAVQQAVPSDG